MADKKSQLESLEQRIAELERLHSPCEAANGEEPQQFCAVPPTPAREFDKSVSRDRREAIIDIQDKWVNGTVLHYYMYSSGPYGGPSHQQQVVRDSFDEWKNLGIGLEFEEVNDISESEIRIGFRAPGSWSYVGRTALNIGQSSRTMNFGWDLRTPHGQDTALHEIGHALGFHHEHQNPNAGIVWDEQAVLNYFRGPPNNWDDAKIRFNILDKIPTSEVAGSEWDVDSIMHYSFGAGLIKQPVRYQTQPLIPDDGLSPEDIEQVKRFYPGNDSSLTELKVFAPEFLKIEPGQQKNFSISPSETRSYNIRTFGGSDTVMVLFEKRNGQPRFLAADDDSGSSLNASIRQRLVKGGEYILRVRLYSNFASGDTAVMLW